MIARARFMDAPGMIKAIETLLIRAVANDLLNTKMEKF